ncbi:MAG: hypothetical protein LC731_07435, partial [Acidobacteria bacterium]|nr:hypothetical protein [Acidobacteriota bacterium]
LATRPDGWHPPIVKTVATENKGLEDLAAAIESFHEFLQKNASSMERRRAIARWRILELLRERLLAQTLKRDSASDTLDHLAAEVADKRRDPYSAVEEIMRAGVGTQNSEAGIKD